MTTFANDDRTRACLAPDYKVLDGDPLESHHTGKALMRTLKDHHGPEPTGERVYGRMMGRAVLMAGVAACIAIAALEACQALLNNMGG